MENPGNTNNSAQPREPWNKGKLIGQKPPLRPKHVWSQKTRGGRNRASTICFCATHPDAAMVMRYDEGA